MTPKEKAQELVEQFASVLMHDEVFEDSIKCALIAVDEIMNADWYIPTFEDNKKWTSYWKEVEHELEKL
jgi:hypothetical protein